MPSTPQVDENHEEHVENLAQALGLEHDDTKILTEEKRKNRLLEVMEDSSSKSDKEVNNKSTTNRHSINSISAILSQGHEENKNRLLLPKVRKSVNQG